MTERYAWQRNAEGCQLVGNLEELRPYDHETFLRCSDARNMPEMDPARVHRADRADLRPLWASLVSHDNGETWRLMWVRETVGELRPDAHKFARGWVIRVDDFNSPEAQEHIRRADSESDDRQRALALLQPLDVLTQHRSGQATA